MNWERLNFLIANAGGLAMTIAPFFVPQLAPLSSPEVQGAIVGAGTTLANVARDIIQRNK